jgi:hypothetical protein
MKKIFIILTLVTLLSVKHANAQTTGVTDTLAYLQNIVAHKSQFIGQSFSVLLDSLQIQIKFFSPFASIPHSKNKETSTSFAFFFPVTENDLYLAYPMLDISWQPYLNATQSSTLYTQYDGGGWAPEVAMFYGSGIIADIQVRE